MSLAYVSLSGRGETDAFLAAMARRLEDCGFRVAGTVQTNTERDCTHHCDMDVRVLPDGPVIRINQDLGEGSTGCRLDPGALEQAVAEVASRLAGADLLIVNRRWAEQMNADKNLHGNLIGVYLSSPSAVTRCPPPARPP